MNGDLIAATILFGPAIVIGTPLMIAAHRTTRHDKAVRVVLAQERAKRAAADTQDTPTPEGGQPVPACDTAPLAEVIAFPAGRAA